MKTGKLSGAWGEALAAEYLRKKKYKIVDAGYHCRFGEIDLIVHDKTDLVFVEVKLRSSDSFARAAARRTAAALWQRKDSLKIGWEAAPDGR